MLGLGWYGLENNIADFFTPNSISDLKDFFWLKETNTSDIKYFQKLTFFSPVIRFVSE